MLDSRSKLEIVMLIFRHDNLCDGYYFYVAVMQAQIKWCARVEGQTAV